MAAVSTENFYKAELNRALRENAFGLKNWTMIPTLSTANALHSAVACVELLEGMMVYIRLTYVGYEVCIIFIWLFSAFEPESLDRSTDPHADCRGSEHARVAKPANGNLRDTRRAFACTQSSVQQGLYREIDDPPKPGTRSLTTG